MTRGADLRQRAAAFGAVLLCLLASAHARATEDAALDALLDEIALRASYMEDVARWKWHAGRPITDPAREDAVLAAGVAQAREAGLQAAGARAFVSAQMAVARSIQRAAFERYATRPPPPDGPDLATELRPAISESTRRLLERLPAALPSLAAEPGALRSALGERLAPLGVEPPVIDTLAAALSLQRLDVPGAQGRRDLLRDVRERGRLRVGTTGDYAPFSARDARGAPVGIDVDLARSLADALGVELVFVATSWPTLMEDLAAGRFDVAMSGVSRTLVRARVAEFSRAYHVGGKTPVVRCADLPELGTLAAIDRPSVRAVVNPGGTNERFARARLQQARIRIFEDNTRIFEEIVEGRADVMFTDAIEARLVTSRLPTLCPAMPGRTLTHQSKGVMLARDDSGALLRFVDLWLSELQGSGELARVFERHLPSR